MGKHFKRRYWSADGVCREVGPFYLDAEELSITGDPVEEAATIASEIGLAGELLGDTETALGIALADYRHWAAKLANEALASNQKLAEWKTKAYVEAQDGFVERKTKIAKLEGDLVFLKAFIEAAKSKGFLLKAMLQSYVEGEQNASIPMDTRSEAKPPKPRTFKTIKNPQKHEDVRNYFGSLKDPHPKDAPENGAGHEDKS